MSSGPKQILLSALGFRRIFTVNGDVDIAALKSRFRQLLFEKSMLPSACPTDPPTNLTRRTSKCLSNDMQKLWREINAIEISHLWASIIAAGCMSFIAAGASANCWELPIDGARVQTGEVAVDRRHVVMGLPEIGRAFVVAADLSEGIELRPPNGDAFADGPGFGTSVALYRDIAVIGAVRTGGHGRGVEQPAGVFHTGAIYTFNISSGELLWHVTSNNEMALGHSVAIDEHVVAFGVYEAPGRDGGSIRLRDATRGSIALRSRDGAPLRVISGQSDARGFGAELSGQAPIITSATNADTLGIWALSDETAGQIASLPATLNGIPATHLAAEGSVVAISAGGGFSADAGRTLLIFPRIPPYEIGNGGPLALSEDRLSVLVRAAPEGQRYNSLVVYEIARNVAPVEVTNIAHVIGSALDGRTAFVILAEPERSLRLCRIGTQR